jgi:hypothetical protein
MRAILLAKATLTNRAGRRARSALIHPASPGALVRAYRITDVAPVTNSRRKYGSPCLEIPARRSLPPLEWDRGVNPSHAAKWRADLNWLASVTLATSADAVTGPMPGIEASRLLLSSCRWRTTILASSAVICFVNTWSWPINVWRVCRATVGNMALSSAAERRGLRFGQCLSAR